MVAPNSSPVSAFQLPDFYSICTFPYLYHKNGDAIAIASEKWVEDGCRVFTEDMRRYLYALKGGQLAAMCYNDCSDERLKVISDFLFVTFLLDDLSDGLMTKDTEILADTIMNAMNFPESYRPTQTLKKGMAQPQIEPDASRLTRE